MNAARYLAEKGIDQFIDIGPGILASPNVHEVVRAITPNAKVAYIDNDPAIVTETRTMLTGFSGEVEVIYGDIRYPVDIAYGAPLLEVIDFSRPVAVLFVAVLHFLTNGDDPYNSVSVFSHRMAPGSYIAISHITADSTSPDVISTARQAHAKSVVLRTRKEIETLFTGLEFVEPGLVEVSRWPEKDTANEPLTALRFLAGIGMKTAGNESRNGGRRG